jgi:hypothetical protein
LQQYLHNKKGNSMPYPSEGGTGPIGPIVPAGKDGKNGADGANVPPESILPAPFSYAVNVGVFSENGYHVR